VRIELQPDPHGAFKLVETVPVLDRDGYFVADLRFPSSGAVRLAWSYPDGRTIHSRKVAVAIS
jgi:hypothetical protein